MKTTEFSAVIIGSGIAGLYAALRISELQPTADKILIITKSELIDSNSRYAQGGIVGVLPENSEDSVKLHVQDTLKAGAGLSDVDVATKISEKSSKIIDDLIKKGVRFDKDQDSHISLTLEAAHSVRRILHSGGDSTGRYIGKALGEKVLENKKITIWSNTQAVELLLDKNNVCHGIVTFNELKNEYTAVLAGAVIIATGGNGQIYRDTTNPTVATGDGIAIACKSGAIIQDMEFIQFHPTALKTNDDVRFLISEAVRGEGAKLKNINGEEFMINYTPKKELAPRDIVTRSIYFEMEKTNSGIMYLDATHKSKEFLEKRFPSITKKCLEEGIDISKQLIPVSPAAHYTMGGIKVTIDGKTNIHGLYATGEVGCTSLHGANRLASNSLLECVVASNELAKNMEIQKISTEILTDEFVKRTIEEYEKPVTPFNEDIETLKHNLKATMWENAGIIRSKESIQKALNNIKEIRKKFDRTTKCYSIKEYELRNMLITALIVAKSALLREESRGSHYRTDFPQIDENRYHSYITKEELINS